MTQIRTTAIMTIKPGKLADFKKAAEKLSAMSKTEPQTQIYQYYASENAVKVVLHEHYESSDGMLAHFANIGDLAASTMALFELERLDVCGDPTPDLMAVLSSLDQSKLTIYRPL